MEPKQKNIIMIVGAVIGTIIGLLAGLILVKNAEQQETKLRVAPKDGVKLGMGVLGLMRLIADMAQAEKKK
jgi:hypothetical protein